MQIGTLVISGLVANLKSKRLRPSIVRWKSRSPDKPALTPTSLSSTDRNQSPDKVGGKKPITARLLCPLPESTTVVISFSSVDSKLCFPRSVIATALRLWRFSLSSTIPLDNEYTVDCRTPWLFAAGIYVVYVNQFFNINHSSHREVR
jgi:hypothetical protein